MGVDQNQRYAVPVRRYEEHGIMRRLAADPIPAFLPRIHPFHRCGFAARLEPFFDGDVFVQLSALNLNAEHRHIARWTPGVRRRFGTEHTPAPMAGHATAVIPARARELGFVRQGVVLDALGQLGRAELDAASLDAA